MSEDTDTPEPISHRRTAWWVVMVLVVLLVLYPLSAGPAVWMISKGFIEDTTVRVAYFPVGWLAENSEAFEELLNWYVEFWIPPPEFVSPPPQLP